MHFDTFANHQDRFQSIADVCIRAGARCVRLMDHDRIIATIPAGVIPDELPMVTRSENDLEIQIFGLSGEFWQSIADTMLDLFSSLINNETELESLTAALVETQDRLVALYDLSKIPRHSLESPALLENLVNEACRLLDVKGAFAILLQTGQAPIIRQLGINQLTVEQITTSVANYRNNPHHHNLQNVSSLAAGLANLMMVSIPVNEDVFAALGVFNKDNDFTSPDIKLAKALAGQAGAQIENTILVQEALARTRLETEMNLAHQVQTALLPQNLPTVPGVDYYATSNPALEVGGDFFDVVFISSQPLIFLLGDVTGKGMPAALLMSMTRTVARSAARNMPFTEPHQLMKRLNADLLDDFSTVGMFTTAFIGMLERESLSLSYCNAGQSPIIYVPVNGLPVMLEAQDIPVGIFDTYNYTSHHMTLSPGDIFIVASDGFPEAQNPAGDMFGYDRLISILDTSRMRSAKEISAIIFDATDSFTESLLQADDRTIIVIKII